MDENINLNNPEEESVVRVTRAKRKRIENNTDFKRSKVNDFITDDETDTNDDIEGDKDYVPSKKENMKEFLDSDFKDIIKKDNEKAKKSNDKKETKDAKYDDDTIMTDASLVQYMKNQRKRRAYDVFYEEKQLKTLKINEDIASHISDDIKEKVDLAVAIKTSLENEIGSEENILDEVEEPLLKCPCFRTDLLKNRKLPKLNADEMMNNYFFGLSQSYSKQKFVRIKIPVVNIEDYGGPDEIEKSVATDETLLLKKHTPDKIHINTIERQTAATPPKKRKLASFDFDDCDSDSGGDVKPRTRSQKKVTNSFTCPVCQESMNCEFPVFEYHVSNCLTD